MVDQVLDCMTQGPLTLSDVLHKMPRHPKKLLMKYDPAKAVKVEDHLDNSYLYLQILEVRYDDVTCRLFPCTLDDRAIVWYNSLPPNSIQNWKGFKNLFLENFADDKTPSMLLKELVNMKMEPKEKVKHFNHRFNHMMNIFCIDTEPHDSISIDTLLPY